MVDEIIKEYNEKRKQYEKFTKKVENLIENLLEEENFNYHSITSRIKESDSLKKKLQQGYSKGKIYSQLSDITDLSGIRIICYLTDDVEIVAEIISNTFKIIDKVDKQKYIEPDRFGYLSLHFIVELSDDRLKLREYQKFKGYRSEIQIRSILQHAWAEIEHDLGYKSISGVPKDIRRKFSRQAGLLELADEQFVEIKRKAKEYEEVIDKIKSYQNISIDNISLKKYIQSSDLVNRIDLEISKITGYNLIEEITDSFSIDQDIKICQFFNIDTIVELDKYLKKYENEIIQFTKMFWEGMDKSEYSYVTRGISIYYLGFYLVAEKHNIRIGEDYLAISQILGENKKDQDELIGKIFRTGERIAKTK